MVDYRVNVLTLTVTAVSVAFVRDTQVMNRRRPVLTADTTAAPEIETEACPVNHGESLRCPEDSDPTPPYPGVKTTTSTRRDLFRYTRAPVLTLGRVVDPRMPGPTGLPIVGALPLGFMRDPFAYTHENARRYGDVYRIPLPLYDLVITNHPDLVKTVLHDRTETFGGPPLPEWLQHGMGMPFPLLNGEPYRERRLVMTKVFSKRQLTANADSTLDEFNARLARWDDLAASGDTVDLQKELAKVTLPGFLRSAFTTAIPDEKLLQIDEDLRRILAVVASLWMTRSLPHPTKTPAAAVRLYRMVDEIIEERLANPIEETDLLQVLIDARLGDGQPLPPKDLRYDLIGLLVAGYETVVGALAWTFALLPTNPGARQRLVDEIDALGSGPIGPAEVDQLTWARACFDEGQRLQGNPFNPRIVLKDTELGGFRVPRGAMVGVAMTAMHRDPRWWANPETFDPNHFADPAQVEARPKTAFIPFGSGHHQCVGMSMAYLNGVYLMAQILRRYEIQNKPGWTPRHEMTQSVVIKGGYPATISRR